MKRLLLSLLIIACIIFTGCEKTEKSKTEDNKKTDVTVDIQDESNEDTEKDTNEETSSIENETQNDSSEENNFNGFIKNKIIFEELDEDDCVYEYKYNEDGTVSQ